MGKKIEDLERAKIFLPFDALKGFKEALRERETIIVEKRELFEEEKEAISSKLLRICKYDMVKIVYFQNGKYISLEGIVSNINLEKKELKIVNTIIYFDDIFMVDII